MVELHWEEDGVDGRPSSMEVLLQWFSVPENTRRWQESSCKRDGTRSVLIDEIFQSLLDHGIKHRTCGGIDSKIWWLMNSFEKVEHWLQRKGLRHFEPDSRIERKVLKACPYYRELVRFLRSPQSADSFEIHHKGEISVRTANDEYSDDVKLTDIDSKRLPNGDKDMPLKRVKVEEHRAENAEMYDTRRAKLEEAEKDVRREIFRLELQAKRDEAICMRVKTRKELLELGVSSEEIDRLAPLTL